MTAAYEVRGLTSKLTSYDNATVGSGSIVNDVALTYNSFGQTVSDAQSHSGAVVSGTTPQVQYDYADGSANMIRPTTLTYPNGRAITISYGTSGGVSDSVSRVDGLIDGSTTLVNYSYLGLGTAVQTTYPQPSLQYTLLGSSSGTSPAGDIYWGLDLFGRIIDSRWFNTGTSADVDRIKYGYDRVSNRIWRQNAVATAAGAQFDEFYTNDGLQRLKDMQRGTLNGTNTGLTTKTFEQCWTLDPTGNWRGFSEAATGGSWTLSQTRTANPVNEITGITNTTGSAWANPAYDAAGNMTTMPQPAAPGSSYTATYDAWNRLVKLVDTATSQTVQQNQYDARTFRTVVLTYTAGVLSETRHAYFTNGWQCIEERVGTTTTADKQFVWGARYIDDLVLRDRGAERLYAMQDANWNVTSLADASGAVRERYAYTAYGTPTYLTPAFASRSTSSFDWETLYSSYRFDKGTGLFQVRHRTYHSDLGSWCERDPIGYFDGTNAYAATYVLGSVDPFGLSRIRCECECNGSLFGNNIYRQTIDCKGTAMTCCVDACDDAVEQVPIRYRRATGKTCRPTGNWNLVSAGPDTAIKVPGGAQCVLDCVSRNKAGFAAYAFSTIAAGYSLSQIPWRNFTVDGSIDPYPSLASNISGQLRHCNNRFLNKLGMLIHNEQMWIKRHSRTINRYLSIAAKTHGLGRWLIVTARIGSRWTAVVSIAESPLYVWCSYQCLRNPS